MTVARMSTLAALERPFCDMGPHVPGPPEVAAALRRYVTRQGTWHLVRQGAWAEAVRLCHRLRDHEVDAQDTGAVASAESRLLAALGTCPADEARQMCPSMLVRLLLLQGSSAVCRAGAGLLWEHHRSELAAAFEQEPNASKPVTYALAEVMAEDPGARDSEGLARLSMVACDHDDPLQYAHLYALKYAGQRAPTLLTTELLRPHCTGSPYDRMVATGLLLYLAFQGDATALALDLPEFWEPRWGYNRVEVEMLRGALAFRGLLAPETAADDAWQRVFMGLETRRHAALKRATAPAIRWVLERYWSLTSHLAALDRISAQVVNDEDAMALLYLFMASPFWEVGERGASMASEWAGSDEDRRQTLVDWSLDPAHQVVHMGVVLGLRMLVQRDRDSTVLGPTVEALVRAPDPQNRGYAANTLFMLLDEAREEERPGLLEQFGPCLHQLLCDEDIWPVQETIESIRLLDEWGLPWRDHIHPCDAPLLADIPDWLELEWDDFTERLEAGHDA